MSFEKLGLNEEIIKAVHKIGFSMPTPIQEQAIPQIINGDKDMVGLAQTGTGKTAAFGLPMIQLVDFNAKHIQGVVICPTRELCMQISEDFKNFCTFVKGSNTVSVYGGASILNQIKQIKKGAQIIVATPGRLLDLINRKVVKLSKVSYVVLDEADEMLNMGFQEDLDDILKQMPKNKRTWLFSATMPREVRKIANNYMNDAFEVTVGQKNSGAENIEHVHYMIKERDRYQALKRIIDFYPDIYGLIFCRTRKETQEISEKLIKDGYDAEALHGDLTQAIRDKVMGRFKEKNLQILVATDVAARGIDVKDISHVINYKLPDETENYTHRSGRTARAGKSGMSIALINSRENRKLQDIERKAKIKFSYAKVPAGNAICEKQLYSMINKLVDVDVNDEEIGRFLPPVYETLMGLSREELIQRFVSLEFNRFLNYYKDSGDINISKHKKDREQTTRFNDRSDRRGRSDRNGRSDRQGKLNTKRFFMNAGKMDNIRKGSVVRLICDKAGVQSNMIGSIEILREFSFFEVETKVAEKVLKSLKGAKIDGRLVSVDYAGKKAASKPEQKKRRKAKASY